MKELPEIFYINVTDGNLQFLREITRINQLNTGHIVGKSKWSDSWKGGFCEWEYNPKGLIKNGSYDFGKELNFEDFKKIYLNIDDKSETENFNYLIPIIEKINENENKSK